MPTISNLTFAISSRDFSNVTLDVAYTVQRTTLERFLGDHGLGFEERIRIIGDDPGEATDQVMHALPSVLIGFEPGELVATRARQVTVPRSSLNEDPGMRQLPGQSFPTTPNPDQLFARVEVGYVGLSTPPTTADSPVQVITVV